MHTRSQQIQHRNSSGKLCVFLAALLLSISPLHAARIKEVAAIEGVRSNQLTGFGLVVGLDGTGDQTTQMPYTSQGLANYLSQLGLTLPAASLALTLFATRALRSTVLPLEKASWHFAKMFQQLKPTALAMYSL